VKARKVKGLDPRAPLADNAERIVRVRLDELVGFMPAAASDDVALHDMRIAAKRLRYVLEIAHPCFGPYAKTAIKHLKALQDVLGEIHDADVHLPDVAVLLDERIAEDAAAADGDPEALGGAPGHRAYAGLVALQVHLRGRRAALRRDFLAQWESLERKGFQARLEFALTERSQLVDGGGERGAMMPPTP
jgi:CHAD domain-containing protein